MADKKQIPIQLDAETKAALDKHQKVSGSKSVNDAIANLLGIDTSKPKAKKIRRIYKGHHGVTAAIIDAAILRCWEHEAIRWQEQKTYFGGSLAEASSIDKSRAEIITAVRKAMERTYSNGATWMSLYPIWYKESLETYVDGRLQSPKSKFRSYGGPTWNRTTDLSLIRTVTLTIHTYL